MAQYSKRRFHVLFVPTMQCMHWFGVNKNEIGFYAEHSDYVLCNDNSVAKRVRLWFGRVTDNNGAD